MANQYEALLDQALAEAAQARERSADLYRELNDLSETATSARQEVKVTVGRQGELTDLSFPSSGFKKMTGPELAAVIVKTAAQAQSQLRARAAALMAPSMPAGVSAEDLIAGKADVQAWLPRTIGSVEEGQ